tara:strand:- start:250 stop:732 length:483 start_codon:yes stop_codon:yes gene_type:complete
MQTDAKHDTGGAVISTIFIGIACLVIWDTQSYVDPDSAVFPKTFALVLIAASLAYILQWIFRRTGVQEETGEDTGGGSVIRRVLLIAVMLGGTLAMPVLGFIGSALPVFAALTLVAMYDPWTRFRAIVYPLVGIAVVLGFFYLFREVLQVPLPVGSLFEG